MKIAALLALIAVAGSTSQSAAPPLDAFALLGDGRIVKLNVATGRVVARRSLGRMPRGLPDHGRMLTLDGPRVYALVPTRPQTVVVTDRELRVKSKLRLPGDVRYRGLVRAGGRTYAFGYREGRVVDPMSGLRESDAVVTRVGANAVMQSWTVRTADGRGWWEWSGSASTDRGRLALSYHGVGTSGADVIDLSHEPLTPPCLDGRSEPRWGCTREHGSIEPYGDGWVATTGGQDLLVLDADGHVVRTIDSGFRNEHLMSLVVDAPRSVTYSLATCFYGPEGLRAVSIATGTSLLVRRAPCGNDLALGPGPTLLAVESADVSAGTSVIALSRSTGRVLHRWRFSGYVVAVAGA